MFVFEKDSSKSVHSDEVFISAVEESDIYTRLIGQHYGNIYKDDVSATEYEYNAYITKENPVKNNLRVPVPPSKILELKNWSYNKIFISDNTFL